MGCSLPNASAEFEDDVDGVWIFGLGGPSIRGRSIFRRRPVGRLEGVEDDVHPIVPGDGLAAVGDIGVEDVLVRPT